MTALVILLVAAAGHSPRAATEVSRGLKDGGVTPHDLSIARGQVCTFCHIPQRADEIVETRWISAVPSVAYAVYGGLATSDRWTTSPEGVTLVCLSCHDGVSAPDRLNSVEEWFVAEGPSLMAPAARWSGEHPVSTGYSRVYTPDFRPASHGRIGRLPLFGPGQDRVECATCHDPHGAPPGPLLRDTGRPDGLCKGCHVK